MGYRRKQYRDEQFQRWSTEPGLPANAQILSTVKQWARSPATTLHVYAAQTQHGDREITSMPQKNISTITKII